MKTLGFDELWAHLDRRRILTGTLYVLKTGNAWGDLPAKLGLGCGKPGPKPEKPNRLQGDRGYDSDPLRKLLR